MSAQAGILEVGAFEAKTHLSKLLDAVERGERVIITRHGKRVAILEPAPAEKKAVFGCAKGEGFYMAPDFDEPLAEFKECPMNYLIDTNAWIGFFEGQKDFSKAARELMQEKSASCHISVASVWEAAIKVGIGKLRLPYDLEDDLPGLVEANGFRFFHMEVTDAVAVRNLERIHGDPFDRIMAVQALRRGWQVISRDPVFDAYGISRIW